MKKNTKNNSDLWPAKTPISLGIDPVGSETSPCAYIALVSKCKDIFFSNKQFETRPGPTLCRILIWVQTGCKGYQGTTLADIELNSYAVTLKGLISSVRFKPRGLNPYFTTSYIVAVPGHIAQAVTCLATDASLTADPGVASLIPARSHTFVEIDHEIISSAILLPSAESFKKDCCQLQAKVCARSTG